MSNISWYLIFELVRPSCSVEPLGCSLVYPKNIRHTTCLFSGMLLTSFNGDQNSITTKEKLSAPPEFEPLSPGTENQCANNELYCFCVLKNCKIYFHFFSAIWTSENPFNGV